MKLENFNDSKLIDHSKKTCFCEVPPVTKSQKEKLDKNRVVGSSDREKIAYYKSHGLDELAKNRSAILHNNEGNGNDNRLTKLNSHNFDRLYQIRNRMPEDSKNVKESFSKWNPDAKTNNDLRKDPVLIKHGSEGEKFKIAHNSDRKASGEYIAKAHAKTPEKIIEHAALPQHNRAERVSSVELNRPQNLIIGNAGPQHKFEVGKSMDGDGIPRTGGLRQIVTEGGYVGDEKSTNPAIRYVDSKEK